MSVFFCEGCQQHRDGDVDGMNVMRGKEFCESCWGSKDCREICEKDTELEKIAKQCDGNSLELLDIDERVKKLEGKDLWE